MFYELRMKREEEWEREMEVISRPMRAKKPVKVFELNEIYNNLLIF